jgi:glucosamine kinase
VSVFVGVDAGASRASALVTDADGRPLARVEGRISLIREASPSDVAASLTALVRGALDAAGVGPADVLCAGLTGVGRDERLEVQLALGQQNVARRVVITTDAEVALYDAFADGPGIILIAGTGSIAWGRNTLGQMKRAGGWGPHLGDGGSGYAIGMAALRAVALAEDEMAPATSLRAAVLDATGHTESRGLIRWADQASRADIAGLAPLVFAADDDAAAAAILRDAATILSAHVSALARRLGPWPDTQAPVVLAGGLLSAGRPMREPVRERIELGAPPMRVLEREVDAARGAAALARG